MYRDELLEAFYNQHGYIPDEEEFEHYARGLEQEDESNQQGYKTVVTPPRAQSGYSSYRQYSVSSEPEDQLIKELKSLFRDLANKAKSGLKNGQNDVLSDERVDEFNYMLTSFLLKSALYFVLKGAFEKGYNYNDLY